jgi:hypothetical protein
MCVCVLRLPLYMSQWFLKKTKKKIGSWSLCLEKKVKVGYDPNKKSSWKVSLKTCSILFLAIHGQWLVFIFAVVINTFRKGTTMTKQTVSSAPLCLGM